jgi:hypothetical protein
MAPPELGQQTPERRVGLADIGDGVFTLDRARPSRREQLPEPFPVRRIQALGDGLFRLLAPSFLCFLAGARVAILARPHFILRVRKMMTPP